MPRALVVLRFALEESGSIVAVGLTGRRQHKRNPNVGTMSAAGGTGQPAPPQEASDSGTSDSDEDSEARKDLLARMQQFRAKKNQRQAAAVPAATLCEGGQEGEGAAPPLCIQIGWPLDYIEYTGIWEDCRRRGWEVIDLSRQHMPDPSMGRSAAQQPSSRGMEGEGEGDCGLIPNVQFVPYKKVSWARRSIHLWWLQVCDFWLHQTAWAALMKGQVLANHYYMRSGIIRKAELATTLLPELRSCHPETHVADLVDAAVCAILLAFLRRHSICLISSPPSPHHVQPAAQTLRSVTGRGRFIPLRLFSFFCVSPRQPPCPLLDLSIRLVSPRGSHISRTVCLHVYY